MTLKLSIYHRRLALYQIGQKTYGDQMVTKT